MQLHEIHPIHKPKKKRRVGRGGKRGLYCGRGIKGQKARTSHHFKPVIRGFIKRYPKLRGYRFKSKTPKSQIAILNLETLEKKFDSEEKVTPQILLEKNLIRRIKGRIPQVKILGEGKLAKKLIIEGCKVSKSAKDKIEKVGGIIK